jgi:hypothetical protein
MSYPSLLLLLANSVLILHVAYISFVLAGLILIVMGGILHWQWVRNFCFRIVHLAAILFVVMESWLGVACPLTSWEYSLRAAAGQLQPEGDFIAYWLQNIFFFDAPAWIFALCYSIFFGLVILSWVLVPPRSRKKLTDNP